MTRSYWLRLGRRTEGPFTLVELQHRIARGALTPAYSVSRDGKVWVAAARCPELFGSASVRAAYSSSEEVTASEGLHAEEDLAGASVDTPHVSGGTAEAVPAVPASGRLTSMIVPQPVEQGLSATDMASSQGSLADRQAFAWPAQVACVFTLLLACGTPIARDANGAIWWWHFIRIWELGGADLCAAAAAWAGVSAGALLSSFGIWVLRGSSQASLLTRCGFASIALVSLAWAAGMAWGFWTLPQCLILVCAVWMVLDSLELGPVHLGAGTGDRRGGSGQLAVGACAGALSIAVSLASLMVRDGTIPSMVAILGVASGAAMIATCMLRSLSGRWGGWATVAPCGTAAMAGITILCDGVAALWSTPQPPDMGTRFAVLDAIRTGVVLLCQCALAYLAACTLHCSGWGALLAETEHPSNQ